MVSRVTESHEDPIHIILLMHAGYSSRYIGRSENLKHDGEDVSLDELVEGGQRFHPPPTN